MENKNNANKKYFHQKSIIKPRSRHEIQKKPLEKTQRALFRSRVVKILCLKLDLNQRPSGFQPDALTNWAIQAFFCKSYIRFEKRYYNFLEMTRVAGIVKFWLVKFCLLKKSYFQLSLKKSKFFSILNVVTGKVSLVDLYKLIQTILPISRINPTKKNSKELK